jgi:alkaline phosphatase D
MTSSTSRRNFIRTFSLGTAAVSVLPLTACGGSDDANRAISFAHGVASGDPLANRVILWTRVSTAGSDDVDVAWVVAEDSGFTKPVASGRCAPARPAISR